METTSIQKNNAVLLKEFQQTRNRTLELVKTLEKDDFVVQTAPYMSPPKWHLGHVSWLYEIILKKINENYEFYSKDFQKYLNSYYHQFGEPHEKSQRGIISRPTIDEIFEYYYSINQRVTEFFQNKLIMQEEVDLFTTTINHECQHQELLIYDLQNLLANEYRPVISKTKPHYTNAEPRTVTISGGIYPLGYNGTEFAYDVEMPEHKVFLNDYKIDVFPVTNEQYLEFMNAGGYEEFKYWLSDGWEAVQKNKWRSPMYWTKEKGQWFVQDFIGKRKINPKEPVCHVSFYEADAYCKWAGTKLPTEAEWEKAACWDEKKQKKTVFPWGNEPPNPENANLLESYLWSCAEIGTFPNGKSPSGCQQMIGDVWEWTASEFVGYPGFKSGFSEYNDKWFTNQKVLRGGSFATPKISIRSTYRNFFRLDERWMFSGFRCAEDV